MLPPAPARLSTMTCCPSASPIRGAIRRIAMSTPAPGVKPTMMRTGFAGKACAWSAPGSPSASSASALSRSDMALIYKHMLRIEPGSASLGATVTGVDLDRPLSDADFAAIVRGLARHGVLCFPAQPIEAAALRTVSARFGALQAMSSGVADRCEPGRPDVSILSNVVANGRPIGIPDAGQDWHTDMTYNRVMGYVNVLVAKQVPVRGGKVLGATEFTDTLAAYDGLPESLKMRL